MTDRTLTPAEKVYSVSAPIFTPEMGNRMRLARMKLLMDQKELGEKFGCPQGAISRLEKGLQSTLEEPFTVLQLKDLFGPLWTYILFGSNENLVNEKHVVKTYWNARLKRDGDLKSAVKQSKGVG